MEVEEESTQADRSSGSGTAAPGCNRTGCASRVIAGMAMLVEACAVPSKTPGLLLGRDFLESVGAIADSARCKLRIGSRTAHF